MSIKRYLLTIALLASLLSVAEARPAYVHAYGEVGQGLLFRRNNACFAITPAHVVEDVDTASLASLGEGGTVYTARVVQRFEQDLALLRLPNIPLNRCGERFTVPRGVEAVLDQEAAVTVAAVRRNGSMVT